MPRGYSTTLANAGQNLCIVSNQRMTAVYHCPLALRPASGHLLLYVYVQRECREQAINGPFASIVIPQT